MSIRVMADVERGSPAGEFSGGVRLRDRRLPRHCWQDNEVWDVFGDELGALGISLYATMTRLCFGVRLTAGVREIAEHARMSKSSCARTLEVLIASGLVIRTLGRTALSACTYELADVKELVAARSKGGISAIRPPVGQMEASQHGTDSPESGTDVSPNGTTLLSKTQDKNQNSPLPPSQARGDVREVPLRVVAGEQVRMAPGAVMGGEFLEASLARDRDAAAVLTAEQSAELDEANRIRARSKPSLSPLTEREWLRVLGTKPKPDALLFDLASRRGRLRMRAGPSRQRAG